MLLNMANNYISIKTIADKVLRHPLMAGISFEAIIDYTVDFMRIVGCYGFFEEKVVEIPIELHKGLLPNDFYEVNQIRAKSIPYKYPVYEQIIKETEDGSIPTMTYEQTGYVEAEYTTNATFTYATNNFHYAGEGSCDLVYKIQGNYIFTSIKEGIIELSYQAVVLDDEGYPMIPDNSKFTRALEAYIKKQWFTILFDMGKIQPAIFQNVQQEYSWAVGACESEFQHLTLDKAESLFKSWRNMIPNLHRHSTGF